MRPKFHPATSYTPLADSVYFRNHQAFLKIKGKSLFRLLEHLIPYLNGHYTLEEITRGLDTAKKTMITKFIETLLSHHFLTDVSQDLSHDLKQAELETYASNIAFIESFHPSAPYHFERFRHQRLLLIGSGFSCAALIKASVACGIKQISVIQTSEHDVVQDARPDDLYLYLTDDSQQTLQLLDTPRWNEEADVLKALEDCDVVLHLSDRPMLARIQLLNKLCIEQKKTCIQAVIAEHHAWIGPLVSPETWGCWECAWRRLQSHLTNLSEQFPYYCLCDHTAASTSQFFVAPVAAMVANRLLFELFKHLTHAGTVEIVESLIDIDFATLLCETHPVFPHPHCRACQHPVLVDASQFLDQVQQLQQQDSLEQHQLLQHLDRCCDPKLGLFRSFDEGDFVQLPLAVCKIELSNPMLMEKNCGSVIGVELKMSDARLSAYRKACELYASNLSDPRRWLSYEAIQQHEPPISVDQLIGACPATGDAWTWAIDLYTRQVCLLPATSVFSPRQYAASSVMSERGIGSGMNWAEAICQALLDWCMYLTVIQLRDAQQPYPLVSLAESPMTPDGAYLRDLLTIAGEQVTVYEVTGPLQLPTFAICWGEQTIAYSTHWKRTLALEAGLKQAVQHYQSQHFQQFEYALAPVPDLPLALRGNQWSIPQTPLPTAWPACQTWLLQSLQDRGLRVLALPLDHDPALRQIMPYIVRILLATCGNEE
ncbi:hypothetical protein KSF_097450 [Reticulibacter mediterranei]|uniref:YcaO domain-containing protein n=1 Tax=Reticulibacter mediterranei TaxID=2778369 RepID=A0A8J3N5W0_9CHLR|nr:TOMM precursor leader peptide-binding protein [Reticulibacter mediterranei]GHO99697.1 hypothetical protein KSF_097450 [Reticulibacter mediterranei]